MDNAIWLSSGWMFKALLISDSAGAIIAPDMSVTRPPREVRSVAAHFLHRGQFLGFVGSSGPSHVTYVRSVSVNSFDDHSNEAAMESKPTYEIVQHPIS